MTNIKSQQGQWDYYIYLIYAILTCYVTLCWRAEQAKNPRPKEDAKSPVYLITWVNTVIGNYLLCECGWITHSGFKVAAYSCKLPDGSNNSIFLISGGLVVMLTMLQIVNWWFSFTGKKEWLKRTKPELSLQRNMDSWLPPTIRYGYHTASSYPLLANLRYMYMRIWLTNDNFFMKSNFMIVFQLQ